MKDAIIIIIEQDIGTTIKYMYYDNLLRHHDHVQSCIMAICL